MKDDQERAKGNRLLEEWDSLKWLAVLALAIFSVSASAFMLGDALTRLTGARLYALFGLTLLIGILALCLFAVAELASIKWTKPVATFVFLTGASWVLFGRYVVRPLSLFRINGAFTQKGFRIEVIEGWKSWLLAWGILGFIFTVAVFPQLAFVGTAFACLFTAYALTVALQIKYCKLRPEHIRAQTIAEILKFEREKSSQKI